MAAGGIGVEIGLYVWLGLVKAPQWDARFHTHPWLTILGYIVGIGAPINALVRIIRGYNKDLNADLKNEPPTDKHD